MYYRVEGTYGSDFDSDGLLCLKNKWDIYIPLMTSLILIDDRISYQVYEIEGDAREFTDFLNCWDVGLNDTPLLISIDGAYIKETSRRLIGNIHITENENEVVYKYVEI